MNQMNNLNFYIFINWNIFRFNLYELTQVNWFSSYHHVVEKRGLHVADLLWELL